jgi:alanine dehydrogenase
MIVGVPKEIKPEEKRVGITPSGVGALRLHAHRVLVERGAGEGSGISDREFREAGAQLVTAAEAWRRAELVLKVKEPLVPEYRFLRPGLILFTYLHLASDERLTRELIKREVTAIGYETIQLEDGSLPLLAPMSEIAGRLSVQVGGWCLESRNGGSGVLLSGASGVRPGKVVILGAGIAGSNACRIAVAMGAHVSIIERDPAKLRYLHDILGGHVTTLMSNRANIEEEIRGADLVIGAVLIAGAKAPRLVSRKLVRSMRPGSAVVDISIDQGGCIETARPTTHRQPIYASEGVVHYAVTNMPGIVPHTSTYALTNATFQYALALADRGLVGALDDCALRRGVNTFAGHVTHLGVAETYGLDHVSVEELV